jgi:general secretion pathway protein G
MKIQRRAERARRAGFSLAELMVVIVIIGLLATLVVPNVLEKLGFANKKVAAADIMTIEGACKEYAIKNQGKYPDSLNELVQKDDQGYSYLEGDNVPTDPWGTEYLYEPPGGGQPNPTITCLGKDGVTGGEGDNADFNNHMIRNKEI